VVGRFRGPFILFYSTIGKNKDKSYPEMVDFWIYTERGVSRSGSSLGEGGGAGVAGSNLGNQKSTLNLKKLFNYESNQQGATI
jgi:hypothetical protein